jgi:hypothetical protein
MNDLVANNSNPVRIKSLLLYLSDNLLKYQQLAMFSNEMLFLIGSESIQETFYCWFMESYTHVKLALPFSNDDQGTVIYSNDEFNQLSPSMKFLFALLILLQQPSKQLHSIRRPKKCTIQKKPRNIIFEAVKIFRNQIGKLKASMTN